MFTLKRSRITHFEFFKNKVQVLGVFYISNEILLLHMFWWITCGWSEYQNLLRIKAFMVPLHGGKFCSKLFSSYDTALFLLFTSYMSEKNSRKHKRIKRWIKCCIKRFELKMKICIFMLFLLLVWGEINFCSANFDRRLIRWFGSINSCDCPWTYTVIDICKFLYVLKLDKLSGLLDSWDS